MGQNMVKETGRPPHNPTEENRGAAKKMSGLGIPQQTIAAYIGICENTLKLHYSDDLALGKAGAFTKIAGRLFQRATEDGDVTALIWYTKTQMGWTDKTIIDNTSSDGSMTPAASSVDLSKLSDAAINELMAARKDESNGQQ